jgi:hypothetical protein
MKKFIFVLAICLSGAVFAQDDVPTTPSGACWNWCNEKQEQLLNDFETIGVLPERTPAVYSGVCNHNGMYNPDVDHYAVVLLDNVNSRWNFSGIFGYFLPENEWQNWTLETARAEMSPYWGEYGTLYTGDNTDRAIVRGEEGNWVYIYWMRQDPKTKDLLLISYAGTVQRTFCRLKKH